MAGHFNKLTPAQAERLALLAEECGEAIQVIGKILRHGFDSTHPDGGRTNRQWLEKELGDIEFAKSLLVENPHGGEPDLNLNAISQAFAEKGMRCFQYLHHNADIHSDLVPSEFDWAEEESQREAAKRSAIFESSNRGQSAHVLATMAIEHGGSGAEVAARLLLSMEHGQPLNVQDLYRLDTENRAHAEVAIAGCVAHELWPSRWMNDEGFDGNSIMQQLRDKWQKSE